MSTITANQLKTGNLAAANTAINPTQYSINADISGSLPTNIAYANYMTVVIVNTDSSNTLTVTLTSPADGKRAVITVTLTIAANGIGVLPPFSPELAVGDQISLNWSGSSTAGYVMPVLSTPNPQV